MLDPGDVAPLLMFFYGTLKRGERNHEHFCGGALRVEEAAVRGDLYDLPLFGYPALVVPDESIYAFGTVDYAGDVEDQRRLGRGPVRPPEGARAFGEVFAFDDPGSRLPAIDRLEGFDPAEASSHYRRALLPVETREGSVTLAWAYVVKKSSGVYVPEGIWPPESGFQKSF
ncbi:MAG: gamma-glutamylcyclotransferase [Rubrobacteraceae bacterium]|nr:gamma-glutamylcyclotransferase [Rubrobacteraceae bacterium]